MKKVALAPLAMMLLAVGVLPARAALVQCEAVGPVLTSGNAPYFLRFDTVSGAYSEGTVDGLVAGGALATDARNAVANATLSYSLQKKTLEIVSPNGKVLASLKVAGHPLRPEAQLVGKDGVARACKFGQGDLSDFYAAAARSEGQAAIAHWNDWKHASGPACDADLDSIGYFQPASARSKGKVAVVFHGVGSNPRAMEPVIRLFLDAGYSVLAPRLRHHFNVDLHDLDYASYTDWFEDSEKAFAMARQFAGPHGSVTVAGFSLGGFLATRLAHIHRDKVDRAVLFAPAWGLNPAVSMASILGNLLHLSLNSVKKTPEACRVNGGYLPSAAGRQVESMILSDIYEKDPDGNLTGVTELRVPYLVVTSASDEVIDLDKVSAFCVASMATCRPVKIRGVDHSGTSTQLATPADNDDYKGIPVAQIVTEFLGENF